jgi:hypothetical protein
LKLASKAPGRNPDVGDGRSFNVTVGAGLYDFLNRHALRAILGKTPSDVAVRLIMDQAIAYDRDDFLGVKLPSQDFPAPRGPKSGPPDDQG